MIHLRNIFKLVSYENALQFINYGSYLNIIPCMLEELLSFLEDFV